MKTKTVAQLKKDADKYFSQYVRYRDGECRNGEWIAECITCGVIKPIKQLQAGHFVSRRINVLRFDDENVNAQCTGCNMFKQGEQYLYAKNLDYKYGDGKAEELMNRRHETHKFSSEELLQVIHDAKEAIKFYQREV